MEELVRDCSTVTATSFSTAACGEEGGARGPRCQLAQEARNFAVVREPVEAQLDRARVRERPGELARHRTRITGSDDGADFVLAEHS